MKIQGIVEVEGVRLHIDIEAPDSREDIYVTNIHPNCLVIPKERWPVEHLGLPLTALQELQERGLKYLGEITDSRWQISSNGLSEATGQELSEALARLRQTALLFEQSTPEELAREVAGFPIELAPVGQEDVGEIKRKPAVVAEARVQSQAPDAIFLSELRISRRMKDILLAVHKAKTVADVLALGRVRLVMTPGVSACDIEVLVAELARVSHELPSASSSQVNTETGEVSRNVE